MAKTIAIATGWDKSRRKEVHRFGSVCSEGQANTWRTFTKCYVEADGSCMVSIIRDGKCLIAQSFGPEEVKEELKNSLWLTNTKYLTPPKVEVTPMNPQQEANAKHDQ